MSLHYLPQQDHYRKQFDNNVDIYSQSDQNHNSIDPGHFDYSRRGIEFFYTRQQALSPAARLRGTGAAILAAESFVEKEHFAVAYGDTIINTRHTPNFLARMIDSHLEHGSACTVGVRPVTADRVGHYGIVKPDPADDLNADSFSIRDLLEKPDVDKAPSHMAVSARYVFSSEIFDEIRRLKGTTGGELGVTDAIRGLIRRDRPVRCVRLLPDETRYDIGSHESYYRAFIDFALQDPPMRGQDSAVPRILREAHSKDALIRRRACIAMGPVRKREALRRTENRRA